MTFRISRIECGNLMDGSHIDEPLAPGVVFTGPNGCGKTMRMVLIQLATLGYIPGGFKKASDILANYAANPDCDIRTKLMLSDDGSVELPLARRIGPEDSPMERIEFYGKKGGKNKVGDFVDEVLQPCVEALDIQIIESMKPNELLRYLFDLVGESEGFDRDSIKEYLRENLLKSVRHCARCEHYEAGSADRKTVARAKLDGKHVIGMDDTAEGWGYCPLRKDEFKEDASGCADWKSELLELFDGLINEILDRLYEAWPIDDGKVQSHIPDLEARAKDMRSFADTKLKESQALGQVHVNVPDDTEHKYYGSMDDLKKEIEDASAKRDGLIGEIATEKTRVEAQDQWELDHPPFVTAVDTAVKTRDKTKAEMREANYDVAIPALKAKLHSDETVEQLKTELADIEKKLPGLDHAKKEAEGKATALRTQIEANDVVVNKFSMEKVMCPVKPTMGCRTTQAQRQKIVDDAYDENKKLQPKYDAATKAHAIAKQEYSTALDKSNETDQAITKYENENERVGLAIQDLTQKQTNKIAALKLHEQNVETATISLQNHDLKKDEDEDNRPALNTESQEHKDRLVYLQSALDVKNAEKLSEQSIAEAAVKGAETWQYVDLLRVLVKILGPTGLISDILKASLAPMSELIDHYLFEGNHVRFESNGGGLAIKMYIADKNVTAPLVSLNTGHKAEFVSAVAIAFMKMRESGLPILLVDRIESIDRKRRPQYLALMAAAVATGDVQFIGASVEPIDDAGGLEIVELGGAD